MVLGYQYSMSEISFEQHEFVNQDTMLLLSDGQVSKSWDSLFNVRRVPTYEAHGIWMFFAWMPLGYALLATKRYFKGNWKFWHYLHILLGAVTTVITIW